MARAKFGRWILMNQSSVAQLIEICREASEEICDVHDRPSSEVRKKDDHSPVTDADMASHRVIMSRLSRLFPTDLLISEESGENPEKMREQASARLVRDVWLIDPLDGTKEFIKRNGQFTVNLGLLRRGIPVFGIIMQPTTGCIYYGGDEVEATYIDQSGRAHKMPLPQSPRSKMVAVVSRSHGGTERETLTKVSDNFEYVSFGSSLKFCRVAEGSADLYLRTSPTSEWDTAASDAILRSVGIHITDHSGQILKYFKKGLRNPPLLALSTSLEQNLTLRNSIIESCLEFSPQLQN
jgi:3'(2'), 5'-bisphosphate nucleotidase